MSKSGSFSGRVVRIGEFCIYAGPCESCPVSVESWIDQFCALPENAWYVTMDPDWVEDWFNNYGIKENFSHYDLAVEMICDHHSDKWASLSDEDLEQILIQAKDVYGLLHARWICQNRGLAMMKKKYDHGAFGTCPRYHCRNEKLLPMGTTNRWKHHSAKLFCPKCYDIYLPPANIRVDGAHFGPAFPHLFLYEYGEHDHYNEFVPTELRFFDFRLHKSIRSFQPHGEDR